MKAIIIGAGLIGVTTAYFLKSRGYQVVVIDREGGVGRGASFANGGLLTPSMAEPWNAPGCWRVLLCSLGRSDAPLQLRARTLPGLVRWGAAFLRNSAADRFESNTLTNLQLALYSLDIMKLLRERTGIEYGRAARGSLRIFRRVELLDRAQDMAERRRAAGLEFRRLSPRQVAEFEPNLEPIAAGLAGAIHYTADEIGDAHRFCRTLAEHARQQGVEFHFDLDVTSLSSADGRVVAHTRECKQFVADRLVVAAGSYSTHLLRTVGVHLPVQPVKGYSLSLAHPAGERPLTVPIVDDDLHAVIAPFEGSLRVAGTAEFAGYDRALPAARIRNLANLVQAVLPDGRFDFDTGTAWCGLRPMSADGVPIIGATPLPNLFVNTGHGHLGWTMAAGSAHVLADLMCAGTPAIRPAALSLARFGGSGFHRELWRSRDVDSERRGGATSRASSATD